MQRSQARQQQTLMTREIDELGIISGSLLEMLAKWVTNERKCEVCLRPEVVSRLAIVCNVNFKLLVDNSQHVSAARSVQLLRLPSSLNCTGGVIALWLIVGFHAPSLASSSHPRSVAHVAHHLVFGVAEVAALCECGVHRYGVCNESSVSHGARCAMTLCAFADTRSFDIPEFTVFVAQSKSENEEDEVSHVGLAQCACYFSCLIRWLRLRVQSQKIPFLSFLLMCLKERDKLEKESALMTDIPDEFLGIGSLLDLFVSLAFCHCWIDHRTSCYVMH